MKVISTLNGRLLATFDPDEVRSERMIHPGFAIDQIGRRYSFIKHSENGSDEAKGWKFETGTFTDADGVEVGIESLEIYNDGVIIVCRTTDDADRTLDDVITFGTEAFGMRRPKAYRSRTYMSRLIVEFEPSFEAAFSKFAAIQRGIQQSYATAQGGGPLDFKVQRIAFAVDPTTVPRFTETEFGFERRLGTPFSNNRWYCVAPLRTAQHLTFLTNLESTLR